MQHGQCWARRGAMVIRRGWDEVRRWKMDESGPRGFRQRTKVRVVMARCRGGFRCMDEPRGQSTSEHQRPAVTAPSMDFTWPPQGMEEQGIIATSGSGSGFTSGLASRSWIESIGTLPWRRRDSRYHGSPAPPPLPSTLAACSLLERGNNPTFQAPFSSSRSALCSAGRGCC